MERGLNETELLRHSAAGDREAFGVLVERYQSLVYAIAYSATGNTSTSEEVAQETFLRAWGNLRQLKDPARFRAWLCRIVRNLAGRAVRRRPQDVLADAAPLEAIALPAQEPGPPDVMIARERQDVVWSALRQIPPKYREPLVLFYSGGQSVRQVAAALDLSEHVVRQRLYRGRQLLNAEVCTLVEDTLTRVRPGRAFSTTVIALLPAVATPAAGAAVLGAKGVPAAKALGAGVVSGAVLGPILGLLGGVLGTWCGIRNTNSPRERRFMIRMAVLVWLLLSVLVGLPLVLTLAGLIPTWAYWSCFAVFFVILLPLVFWANVRQRRIQLEEGTCHRPECALAHVPRPGMRGGFAGPIFGGTAWLLVLTVLTGDWVSFGVIVGCDVLLLLGATALYRHSPQRYWSVALLTVCALLAMTFAAVNLRWAAWMDAYRRSSAYEPINDISLRTLNLILLGAFVALLALFATQYARHKATRKGQTPGGHQ